MSDGYTVDALGRRKWDKDFYRKQSEDAERARQEAEAKAKAVKATAPLKRDSTSSADLLANQAGKFHCSVCDVTLRDSAAYLDHVNGKAHNRALGMTMQVQNASIEEVRTKILEIRSRLYPDEYY